MYIDHGRFELVREPMQASRDTTLLGHDLEAIKALRPDDPSLVPVAESKRRLAVLPPQNDEPPAP